MVFHARPDRVIFDAIISAPGKYPIVDHSMRNMTIGAAGALNVTP
jgi:hypothetical protein